ncbi:Uncharacterised protein [Vibrio cholerae]|nr:Uncharacterised protein [Vibrio cholerae]
MTSDPNDISGALTCRAAIPRQERQATEVFAAYPVAC